MRFFGNIQRKWSEMSRLDKTAVTVFLSAVTGKALADYQNRQDRLRIDEKLKAIEASTGHSLSLHK